ncbi:MAG: hypothetical protein JST09_16575 [Bacteroidetes bacterium]|nr:hypothetical protein [Bacteroidota bacterium]MBS1607549.1 hypothetical protein [Bacteroidota bacterium]
MGFFCITVHLYNKKTALRGIREYGTSDYNTVYKIAMREILKYYTQSDIIKIDVWPITEDSPEVQDYIWRRALPKEKKL